MLIKLKAFGRCLSVVYNKEELPTWAKNKTRKELVEIAQVLYDLILYGPPQKEDEEE